MAVARLDRVIDPAIHAFARQIKISIFLLALLLSACLLSMPTANATSTVPFVGCPGGGMVDTSVPTGKSLQVAISKDLAAKLALYVGEYLAILGPRNWTCSGMGGTASRSLFLHPSGSNFLTGPGIILTEVAADPPSGAPFILSYAGRYFPNIVDQKYIDNFVAAFPSFPSARSMNGQNSIFPNRNGDRIIYLNQTMLEFQTPAMYAGLGPSLYARSEEYTGAKLNYPVSGFMRLMLEQGEAYAIDAFSVALPKSSAELRSPIINFEKACILRDKLNSTKPYCDVEANYPDASN
jgi:hypothetical protein